MPGAGMVPDFRPQKRGAVLVRAIAWSEHGSGRESSKLSTDRNPLWDSLFEDAGRQLA